MSTNEPEDNMYLRFWSYALKGLAEWTDRDIEEFSKQFENEMNDEDDWFYHEDPLYYVVVALTPRILRVCLEFRLFKQLTSRIRISHSS